MSKKNLINLLFLGIMVLAIPLTINLVRQQQILLSRAAETKVEFLTKELGGTDCVINRNNQQLAVCKDVAVRFTAPTGVDIRLQSSTSILPQEGFVGKANAQESCPDDQTYCDNGRNIHKHGGYWDGSQCVYAFDDVGSCSGNGGQQCNWHDAGYTESHDNQTCEVWTDGCNNWDWKDCKSTSVPSNSNEGQACGDYPQACDAGGTMTCHKTIQNGSCQYSSCGECTGGSSGRPSGGQCPDWQFKDQTTTVCGQTVAGGEPNKVCNYEVDTCTGNTRAKAGSCKTVSGTCDGGVAIGTGGCCSGNSDCKASNIYKDQSTADWTCTDTNPACSGGKACKAPAGAADTTKRDDNADCTLDSQCKSNNCPSNPNNPSFHKCLGSSVVDTQSAVITKYRFAENPTDLATAAWKNYSAGGVVEHYSISDTTPGQKFVFVQFQDSAGHITERKSGSITYSGPDPVITGSACNINLDLKDGSLIFQANGDNFGARELSSSTLVADNSNLEIKEWTNQKVVARMVNPPDTTSGKTYTVTTTRSDGVKATSSCGVNTTQISLGAKLFCRAPSNFDQENVSLTIIQNKLGVGTSGSSGNFQAGDKAKETVTITKEGVIQNLKTKLQKGMEYIICIKAPKSLRVCTDKFTAVEGNNIIQNFSLPVGDVNGDDVINSVDAGICKAEWGSGTGTKACEFNRDNTTNSFEWSCLMHDYGKSSQAEPI